jgi:hypothetical protein
VADPEVDEAFSRSFLTRLPSEVVRAALTWQVGAYLRHLADGVEGLAEVIGDGGSGGDGAGACLDLDAAVAGAVRTGLRIDWPACVPVQRLTVRAAKTTAWRLPVHAEGRLGRVL